MKAGVTFPVPHPRRDEPQGASRITPAVTGEDPQAHTAFLPRDHPKAERPSPAGNGAAPSPGSRGKPELNTLLIALLCPSVSCACWGMRGTLRTRPSWTRSHGLSAEFLQRAAGLSPRTPPATLGAAIVTLLFPGPRGQGRVRGSLPENPQQPAEVTMRTAHTGQSLGPQEKELQEKKGGEAGVV